MLGLALFLTAALLAPDAAQVAAARHKAHPELMAIVDAARLAPPEFSADALLRVAECRKLTDTQWKRELAEEAFQNATAARNPIRQSAMVGPPGRHVLRVASRLDRLSLQVRAVKIMLRIDARRARILFEAMSRPVPRRLTCSDTLLDEPSPYYDLLAEIIDSTFTPEERRKERHLGPALAAVAGMASAVEIAPIANLISKLNLSVEQRELLATQFASALARIEGDDRVFGSSLWLIEAAMRELTGKCGESAGNVRAAYRKFLLANFKGPRCAEDFDSKLPLAAFFSDIAAREGFTEDERKPGEVAGAAVIQQHFESAEARRFLKESRQLMFTAKAQRDSAAWREKFDDFVRGLENWKPAEGQTESELFRLRGGFLSSVAVLLPPGAERDQAILRTVGYFTNSPAQSEDWLEWFNEVQSLVRFMRALEPTEGAKFLAALEASGHPVLALYAKIERSLSDGKPD
jgi:hypothetical protein